MNHKSTSQTNVSATTDNARSPSKRKLVVWTATLLSFALAAPSVTFAQSKKPKQESKQSKEESEMEAQEKKESKKSDKDKSDSDSMDKEKKDDDGGGFGADRKKTTKSKSSRADREKKEKDKDKKGSDKSKGDDEKKAKDKRVKVIEAALPRKKDGFFLIDLIETRWETMPARPGDVDPYRGQQGNGQTTKRAVVKHDFHVIDGRQGAVDKIVDHLGEAAATESKSRGDRRDRSSGSSSRRSKKDAPPPTAASANVEAPAEHTFKFIGVYNKKEDADKQLAFQENKQKQEEENARLRGMR